MNWTIAQEVGPKAAMESAAKHDVKGEAPAAKDLWEMTRGEFAANQGKSGVYVQQQRDAVVKKALAAGKPVPAEVLKDYPGLAEARAAIAKVEDGT